MARPAKPIPKLPADAPTVYVLVGVPASGKTTWYEKQVFKKETVYVSTDAYIEKIALQEGKTYSEVFMDNMKDAIANMLLEVKSAHAEKKDIVWDQPSCSPRSRNKKFRLLKGYRFIAVVFPIPKLKVLNKRLKKRPGKTIPPFVMESMISSFEMPTIEEGFHEIVIITAAV